MVKRMTTKQFVVRAKEIHGDKYDYSFVQYINAKTRITIVCPKHGKFKQIPGNHLQGKGCYHCSYKNGRRKKTPINQIVLSAREIHGNRYDYSKVVYQNKHNKVTIICPIHGEFEQSLISHINLQKGCPTCSNTKRGIDRRNSKEQFVKMAQEIHGDKYDYSKTQYTTVHNNVIITCRQHGDFLQLPSNHLKYHGCKRCSVGSGLSAPENELQEFVKSLNIEGVVFNDRSLISPKEIDIYFPKQSIAIEFDGLYWHSESTDTPRNYHLNKTEDCLKQGIQLIHIFENEWANKQEIVKDRLKNLLNAQSKKVFARKGFVRVLTPKEERAFFDKTHLQGYASSNVCFGLLYNGEIVCAMSFGTPRYNKKYEWELIRFSSQIGTSVVGGAGKLFNAFLKNKTPESIITYADRRWSQGNLYKVLGFEQHSVTSPNYFYFKGNHLELYSRVKFQKHKLKSLLETYNKALSESQNMKNNGYHRIYDCGNIVYVFECHK